MAQEEVKDCQKGNLEIRGGEEKHRLTKNEMPRHNHYIRRFKGGTANDYLGGSRADYGISSSYNEGTVENRVI